MKYARGQKVNYTMHLGFNGGLGVRIEMNGIVTAIYPSTKRLKIAIYDQESFFELTLKEGDQNLRPRT